MYFFYILFYIQAWIWNKLNSAAQLNSINEVKVTLHYWNIECRQKKYTIDGKEENGDDNRITRNGRDYFTVV